MRCDKAENTAIGKGVDNAVRLKKHRWWTLRQFSDTPGLKSPLLTVTAAEVETYAQTLEEKSKLYQLTGGAHGGCLAQDGEMNFFSFDVSRHNVFDKLYGRCLLENIERENKIMVFSGRVSAEIILKLAKMNLSIIIARSAPTSLALDLARKSGITVIAFARDERFNVYTYEERVIF